MFDRGSATNAPRADIAFIVAIISGEDKTPAIGFGIVEAERRLEGHLVIDAEHVPARIVPVPAARRERARA